jgi:2-hydroxychromene-2-carboxylate isomerase
LASVARIAAWFGVDAAALARATQDQHARRMLRSGSTAALRRRQFAPGRDDWFRAA